MFFFYMSGIDFSFKELPIGGVALDLVGVPLPEETLTRAKQSDAVLLGAVGWYCINVTFIPNNFSTPHHICMLDSSQVWIFELKAEMG